MYKNTIDEKLEELRFSRLGLSEEERTQRRQDHGYNELVNNDHRSFLSLYGEGLRLPALKVLFIAALFFAFVRRFEESLILLGIFVLYSLIGSIKSYRGQKAREIFLKQNIPTCKVLQEENIIELPMRDLVPGDIVLLEEGDIIPADGRLIEGDQLWIDESLLTGVEHPFCKDVSFTTVENIPLGERANMVYASTLVCEGQGLMIVTNTGMGTEVGKVAFMLYKDEESESLLDKKLMSLGKGFRFFVIVLSIALGVYSFLKGKMFDEAIFVVIALALAASPKTFESLVLSLVSFGSLRFSKHDIGLKKFETIENLSSVSLLLLDERPFLTDDTLRVKDLSSTHEEDEVLIKKICLLAASENTEENSETLKALRRFVIEEDPNLDRSLEAYTFVERLSVSDGSDLFSSHYEIQDKGFTFALGNLEDVLGISGFYHLDDQFLPIEEEIRQGILETRTQFENEGKRVIALAYKDEVTSARDNLNFLGLVALGDPGRGGVKEAIKTLKNAGIRPILLTRSSIELGSELARELSILIPGYEIITGEIMKSMSEEDFELVVENYSVYVDLSSEQRSQLVKMWKKKGAKVAITTEDAQGLSAFVEADISIASQSQKSGVIKQEATLLLPEDRIMSFGEAVAEARRIFYNLRKKVRFELSIGLALLIAMIAVMAMFNEFAFSYLSLIWLGFVVTALPGLALEREAMERNIMIQKPPLIEKGLITRRSFILSFFEALLIAAVTVVAYYVLVSSNKEMARTLSYATFGFGILFQSFGLRNSQSVLGKGFFSNKSFFAAFVLSAVLVILPVILPVLAKVFTMVNLPLQYWGLSVGLDFVPVIVTELRKIFIKE